MKIVRHALNDHTVSSQKVIEKKKRACCAQVVPGDIVGETVCSLDPAFMEKGAFAFGDIGAGAVEFSDELAEGVFSPSSSSTMGGQ